MTESKLEKLLNIDGLSDLVLNGHLFAFANIHGDWLQIENPFESASELLAFSVDLAASARRRLDFSCPFADIAAGSVRYHLALPLSGDRVHVSIRKHQSSRQDLSTLLENPMRWQTTLQEIVRTKGNFIICGGTGSGKTTLLRAMLELASFERVVTVEDVSELELGSANVVSLQTRQANTDGAGQIDLQRLVVESLRMKPDRIVVGEVRGTELVPMLQALNSGHRGSATTVHANRAEDVPARLVGIGLLGGLSPATTAHLAASAFDRVIALGPRTRGINITSIASFELTRESKLVTKNEH
jgi:pilus assembly protein CpaF